MRGHGNSVSRIGMRGAFTPPSIARMPMHRAPMMNSALGVRRFNGFNNGNFHGHDRFHRFHRSNKIIFIGNFGFPWWWGSWSGWNSYPHGPYEYSEYSYPSYYSYPSSYSGYGYGYGSYGYSYGYNYPPLLYYGGYYSATNYENDESVVRDVLAEYTVSWNGHDTAALARLLDENCDYADRTGVHWKGVQAIIERHAELFKRRLKTAVRRLTGAEVTFSTPDVALVHATWDVTGGSPPTGKAVPVLKEITTMKMVKTNGKWLITDVQDAETEGATQ
ncbi:MAG TPA: SgcJ/EcaC family oxidoreductase [Candidatus Udaeobacter sp.]